MEQIENTVDVLIAGAGPAGLMMACQLVLQHISFRIIDPKDSPAMHSGALIVHGRTLEIFHQMGLGEKAISEGIIAKKINIQFAHKKNIEIDMDDFGKQLTRYPYLLMLEQWRTENLLIAFLNEHGHNVCNGTALMTFSQETELVTAKIKHPDGTIEVVKSRFIIGADGHNSLVRSQMNIPFPGKTHLARLFITDCQASLPLPCGEIFFSFNSSYTVGCFPLRNERYRIDGLIPLLQERKEVHFDDVRNYFKVKIDSGIVLCNPQWFSVFRSHSRCADAFRKKCCFLIGDAAHVHSPVGAQGMNTALQDAFNLAWKLAFFIKGKAKEKVLDTYQAERRPLALRIIRYTDIAFNFMTAGSFLSGFFRMQLMPMLLPKLLIRFRENTTIRNYLFTSVSGIGIKYRHSLLSGSSSGNFPVHSPRPGERLPYLAYPEDGKSSMLGDGWGSQSFHLLIFGNQKLPHPFQLVVEEFSDVLSLKFIALDSRTRALYDRLGMKDEGCYLVRPDGYIAWRSIGFNALSLGNYLQNILK